MIRAIIDKINDRMNYPFRDVHLGVLHPHDNKGKKIPMSSDGVTAAQAIPDGTKRCIVYWEDYGSRTVRQEVRFRIVESTLRLVVWLNFNMLAYTYDDCVREIMAALPKRVDTTFIVVDGQLPKSNEIFERYDYQDRKQYITYPYDAIALVVKVKYVDTRCSPLG